MPPLSVVSIFIIDNQHKKCLSGNKDGSNKQHLVQERKIHLTASNFGKVHNVLKVSSIHHGKQSDNVVRFFCVRQMQKQLHQNCVVYDCGLVVNPSHP